ncbi:MAG: rod shape-determining protein MreC [Desulfomonilia bacterium]|nr:rod shape-determining protein MreC [Desulfomonilia bacterium]
MGNHKGTRNLFLLVAAALIILLLSFGQNSSSSLGLNVIREGFFFFERIVRSPVGFVHGLWLDYIYLVDARQENQDLKKLVDEMQVKCMILDELREENWQLKAMMDYRSEHQEFVLYPAKLLAQDITMVFKSVIIDRGSRHGFYLDMPIVNPDGVVGRVIAVSPRTAEVLLVTDPNSAIPAHIEDSRIKGIVKGRGINTLSLEYVRRAEEVHIGSAVVTSGLLGMFPKGLILGYVQEVTTDENKMFAQILISPSANMEKIEIVFGLGPHVEAAD